MSSPPETEPRPQSPPPTAPPPPIIQALSYSPLKKPQPIPWSHEETLNLIKAYQEKWYSLKRGQLKASQWEEVAITVAARCGLDEPSKSGTQCRHKIEKLRKRYRAEKQKMGPNLNYHNHPWIYFSLMDQLERGPLPISAVAPANHYDNHVGSDEDDEEGGGGAPVRFGSMEKLRRDDRVAASHNMGRNGVDFDFDFDFDFEGGGSRILNKRKSYWERDNDHDHEEQEKDYGRYFMPQLAAQIRGFAENFVRIQNNKLDFIRENHRLRIQMESKKREMILVYQHKTIELINKAFTDAAAAAAASSSEKKMKMMTPDL